MAIKKEPKPVNVYDDKEMTEAGFPRGAVKEIYDWSKTKNERKALKKMKHRTPKLDGHFGIAPKPYSGAYCKIVIKLKKNGTFPYTTYSKICNLNNISEVLERYSNPKTGKTLVTSYTFNGRTYMPNERPVNPWRC